MACTGRQRGADYGSQQATDQNPVPIKRNTVARRFVRSMALSSIPVLAKRAARPSSRSSARRFYAEIGKKGGESTKRQQGAEFYSRIGKKGGERGRGTPKQQRSQLRRIVPYERSISLKKRRRVALASFLAVFAWSSHRVSMTRALCAAGRGRPTAHNNVAPVCDLSKARLQKTPALRPASFLYNGCYIGMASMSLVGTNLPGQAVPLSSERNGTLRLSA